MLWLLIKLYRIKWKTDMTSFANQMVLCQSCQYEKPDVADAEIVWQWLEVEK